MATYFQRAPEQGVSNDSQGLRFFCAGYFGNEKCKMWLRAVETGRSQPDGSLWVDMHGTCPVGTAVVRPTALLANSSTSQTAAASACKASAKQADISQNSSKPHLAHQRLPFQFGSVLKSSVLSFLNLRCDHNRSLSKIVSSAVGKDRTSHFLQISPLPGVGRGGGIFSE